MAIEVPDPSRQLAFHEALVSARSQHLKDALREAVSALDPDVVRDELAEFVPKQARSALARAGIRDEEVFPTPSVLSEKPTLVGYYRLLLGASQKRFYDSSSGLAKFKAMELSGMLSERARADLPDLCRAMGKALADLVAQLSPPITQRDVDELPLLTLGSQFQGSNNNKIGEVATRDVFLSVRQVVEDHVVEAGKDNLVVENSAGRRLRIVLSADPDIRLEEEFEDGPRRLLAVEIKGGTDRSNAHNRAGEAEKSHQKAKALGFTECWTVIAKAGLDLSVLEADSPTTNLWFDTAQVLGREGPDWEAFRTRLIGTVGIPA